MFVLNAYSIEMFKMPQLVSHFLQHKSLNSDVSFLDFLDMHYFGEDLQDNDDEEDMKLPFKKIEGQSIISFAIPAKYLVVQRVKCFLVNSSKPNKQSPDHCDPIPGCLFRPPKVNLI